MNLWEGQLASLAWAWDNGRVFQTAALFLFGLLIGRRGLFLKENLKVWNKILCGALVAFFPLYGLGNMLPDFISNPSVIDPLNLVVSSLYKFAFMLVLVSGGLMAFYRTRMQAFMRQNHPIRQDEPDELHHPKHCRSHALLQLGLFLARRFGHYGQPVGRNGVLRPAIFFLQMVDETPRPRPVGICVETGHMAEMTRMVTNVP